MRADTVGGQHAKDDKQIHLAMHDCMKYLRRRFAKYLTGRELKFQETLSYGEIIAAVRGAGLRTDFDRYFDGRTIKPDGGIITLRQTGGPENVKIVLVSEVKRQGTNDKRLKEGLKRQAQGNAIERLGKNLTGIKTLFMHEKITPFVCFGHGCDFVWDYEDDFVMAKISMLNEFYPLNKIYVNKKDGDSNRNHFSPVSMFFREQDWTREEMLEILKEVGESAIRHYIF